ncbi:MAG: hypothetical protein ABS80_18005 [Pseudonocardia sp. SCN 72-51]|nr:MAG: hypothetical protein ABS80_18005 [Pseudonocardia sp. SCN 72-51]
MGCDFTLTPEQKALQANTRDVAQVDLAPRVEARGDLSMSQQVRGAVADSKGATVSVETIRVSDPGPGETVTTVEKVCHCVKRGEVRRSVVVL